MQDVEHGLSTYDQRWGNRKADEAADEGVKSTNETFLPLANYYGERSDNYRKLMKEVQKVIIAYKCIKQSLVGHQNMASAALRFLLSL